MNDLTLWLLIIGCPLAIWILVIIEFYFIIRFSRKNAILNRIKNGSYFTNQNFDIIVPATLYGKSIEVAIKNNFIHLINDGKFFSIHIDDFISIEHKKGKYIFKIANSAIVNTKVFSIKCNDDRLNKILPITTSNSQIEAQKSASIKEFSSKSTVRFIIIAICYIVFFVIFALLGKVLDYFITTILFIAGVAIYILLHYANDDKQNSNLSKTEILEKKAKNRLFYSNVIAICLAIALIISAMVAFIPRNTEEYDPYKCYWCEGSGMYVDEYGRLHYCSHCHGSGKR